MKKDKTTWLDLAFHLCGGVHGMADCCGLTVNATRCWKRNGYFPPDRRGKKYSETIEKRTNGMIKASRLLDECLDTRNKVKKRI